VEIIRIRQGRTYWYVNERRVSEIYITHANVSSVNTAANVPVAFEILGRLRVENGVAYVEGY